MLALAVVSCMAWGAGCGPQQAVTQLPEAEGKLRGITILYARAAQQLRRGPKTREDLLAPLAGKQVDNPEDLLRSPRDGEFYEIVWGLDLSGRDNGYTGPLAYEKVGVDGKRMVVNGLRQISEVDAAGLKALPFPPKYQLAVP